MSKDRNPDLYRTLLESLSDGVMVIEFDGSVRIANAAFCRMFGFDPEEVAGRLFGELFLMFEEFDEFVQIILNVVAEQTDGERQIVRVRIGEELRSLSVVTSYLTTGHGEKTKRAAVIAVVSDITEVRELHEAELEMKKVIEKQLDELQTAYRDLEAQNEAVSQMGKKIQTARNVAVAFVLGLFLIFGTWYIRPLDFLDSDPMPPDLPPGFALGDPTAMFAGSPGAMQTMTLEPGAFDSTISLRGNLVPGRVMEVVSPIESHASTVHTAAGQQVTEGDLLIELDAGRITAEHRQARIEYIKARDRLAEIEDWESSAEMARARRALRRAKMGLDDAEQNFTRIAFLLEEGIVSTSEYEGAQRQRQSRQLDFEEAQRELETVRAQGSPEEKQIAKLEAQNAQDRLRTHAAKLDQTRIRAPISGVILAAEGEAAEKPLARGRRFSQGELVLRIADFSSVSVATQIDEADVRKVQVGQKAWITGPGFPDLSLEGSVTLVSSRASGSMHLRNTPQFDIVVTLSQLPEEALDRLKVGMSAHVTIVVYSQSEAILIPIHAVEQAGDQTWIHVLDPETEAVERRAVKLGLTTLETVEVLEGLSFGETVVLSP